MKTKQKAFTLIELLIVCGIIATLSAVITIGYKSAKAKSRDAKRVSDLNSVATTISLFRDQFDKWPDNISSSACIFGLVSSDSQYAANQGCLAGGTVGAQTYDGLVNKSLISVLPSDPSGSPHSYQYFGYGTTCFSGSGDDSPCAIVRASLENVKAASVGGWSSSSSPDWCKGDDAQEFCLKIK